MKIIILGLLALSIQTHAIPYWDQAKVPVDPIYKFKLENSYGLKAHGTSPLQVLRLEESSIPVLRVQIDWLESENYQLRGAWVENSGTEALHKKSRKINPYGSYRATLSDAKTGQRLFFDSIGTGREFRKLTRALTFRFPVPENDVLLTLEAEHPTSGLMIKELQQEIPKSSFVQLTHEDLKFEAKLLRRSLTSPSLKVVIYAEGYAAADEARFWSRAQATVAALEDAKFPGQESFEFMGVFSPSREELGRARELELPVLPRDSFLGLYYPYWENFGRWYNVVYPTSEEQFRRNVAVTAYDYPIVLVKSEEYWGVGNYAELTAIPDVSSNFTYLLLHEFGHFFGLNEEYEGGGRTELEFAPQISEPWSQNITFLNDPTNLKWKSFVPKDAPIPATYEYWSKTRAYSAYVGGYGDSSSRSHKPGHACVMERAPGFCAICTEAIRKVIQKDLGQ